MVKIRCGGAFSPESLVVVIDGDAIGHQVIKFSSTGEELMRLGIPGKAGKGDYQFNAPADVVIGDNGNIFIADGHNPDGNNRVMVYNKEGEFLRSWGQTGYAPGEFHALHAAIFGETCISRHREIGIVCG